MWEERARSPTPGERAGRRNGTGMAAALVGLAWIAAEDSDAKRARRILSQVPRTVFGGRGRRNLLARLNLLRACSEIGGADAVAVCADRIPGATDALYALGVCLASRGRYVQALEHLFLVAELDPDYRSGAAKAVILRILGLAGKRNRTAGQYWERLGRVLHRPEPGGGRPGEL